MIGLLGKKLGMTNVYDQFGRRIAVTAIQAGPCTVTRLRDSKQHGYQAIQVGFEAADAKRQRKPDAGQLKKAGLSAFRYLREFRLDTQAQARLEAQEWKVGQQLTVELFQENELVDVTGTSIGKGFQGGMKRWNWRGGSKTHGSTSHRRPGSIGSTTTPGRVIKGHHLPGHMGSDRVTIQNVRIVRLDAKNHLLLVAGSVPGSEEQLVLVRKSVKRPGVIKASPELPVIIEDDGTLSKTAKAASKTLKPKK